MHHLRSSQDIQVVVGDSMNRPTRVNRDSMTGPLLDNEFRRDLIAF